MLCIVVLRVGVYCIQDEKLYHRVLSYESRIMCYAGQYCSSNCRCCCCSGYTCVSVRLSDVARSLRSCPTT